jgi:hypothetical protein
MGQDMPEVGLLKPDADCRGAWVKNSRSVAHDPVEGDLIMSVERAQTNVE